MPDSINCGAYTKFNGGLCSKRYAEKHKHEPSLDEIEVNDVVGLTEKEKAYRYGMIKGRIAETLIQELFLSHGYNVFRYGMGNTTPVIMELFKGVQPDVQSTFPITIFSAY